MFASSEKRIRMLRGSSSAASLLESLFDPSLVFLTLFAVAHWFDEPIRARYVILGLLTFALTFPGELFLMDSVRRMARKTVFNWVYIAGILLLFGYGSGYVEFFPRDVLVAWAIAVPVVLVASHLVLRALLPRIIEIDGNRHSAVIAGCNEIGLRLAASFARNPYLATRCVGFFDDRHRERLEGIGTHPLLGRFDDLPDYVKRHHIDRIYLALPMASQPRILRLLDHLKDTTASIFFAPDIFLTDLIQGRLETVGGMPVVAVCETPFTGFNGVVKRLSDIILAALILLLLAPLMVAIAIGVKLSSPGPVIFRQRRYGLDGKEITVFKFRSMTVCEDGTTIRQARRDDQRITPIGRFLRRSSLDELPQFINVLTGRMSIVGPRPHAVAHNETYRRLVKGYMVRHKVKPGITGWAQVNGYRGETDTLEKMEKRIEHDLDYLRDWSIGLDLWIIVKTALLILRDRHAY